MALVSAPTWMLNDLPTSLDKIMLCIFFFYSRSWEKAPLKADGRVPCPKNAKTSGRRETSFDGIQGPPHHLSLPDVCGS